MSNTTVYRKKWSNWSGTVNTAPEKIVYPRTIEEVASIVMACSNESKYIRVVGSGHSFSAVAASDQVLMSLDEMQGIVNVNRSEYTATVWAGTKLKLLGELLYAKGLAQVNLGDIDLQTIGGAISTGTHGTGKRLGSISTQVVGITVVNGLGEIMECTEESHPQLFKALQISLGSLGIIVQVKLKLKASYLLGYESMRMQLDNCLPQMSQLAEENRHFEMYWFPYANTCQVKIMNEVNFSTPETPLRDYFNEHIMENSLFGALSMLCKSMPSLTKTVSRLSASSIPVTTKAAYSHKIYATKRMVRFNEMEYNVPAEALEDVIRDMRKAMDKQNFHVHFPVECRYVASDNIWLSPSYERDSAYIAIHMYRGMPYEQYFNAMEEIFLHYEGRPHWGKMHSLKGTQLQKLYPRWNDFIAIQSEMDPQRILLSPYMQQLLHT
ncbi:D-arabinono-1,4-lactone oxidase [Paenibacillus endoradicis]|uniref:D-arabinono-1,4-lactone oxidase n=1 Tax=Paenibacillus endoradicis TaxID=2972487 RepID=UPI002158AC9D|nr:D-arabinono-1,4-lactone oxidase [Paenibacillus endoradicis]MCR8657785.1 FAD-binding protein [Paenibacillus endoradicis]